MAKFQFKYVYYLLIKFSTASFVTLCHCEIEFKGFFTQQGESEPQQNGSHHGGDRDEIDDEDEGEDDDEYDYDDANDDGDDDDVDFNDGDGDDDALW